MKVSDFFNEPPLNSVNVSAMISPVQNITFRLLPQRVNGCLESRGCAFFGKKRWIADDDVKGVSPVDGQFRDGSVLVVVEHEVDAPLGESTVEFEDDRAGRRRRC